MRPVDLGVAARAGSSWTGSASMSARSTTVRPGRPPSRAKIPPVSVTRRASPMPRPAMWLADHGRRVVLGEGELGSAVHRTAAVDHVVEDGVGGGRPQCRRGPGPLMSTPSPRLSGPGGRGRCG